MFRTFALPIPLDAGRYVRALEFQPGKGHAVHHANLGIERTRSRRRHNPGESEPGYDAGMMPDASPEGQSLGWAPGQTPHPVPPGLAWRLETGSDLVVQLHMQPTGRAEAVQVRVGFFFTDEAPTRLPVALRLGSETIDLPAGEREYVVTDSYVLPVDVDVVSIQPHAHYLGRRMEATATWPDGWTQWLISIPDWDFRWQDVYRFVEPLALPKGTRISMRFTYDNSAENRRNPHQPPRHVVWGQNTTDEMGDLWVQVVPRTSADLDVLRRDFYQKAHAEDLAAHTKRLRANPMDPMCHDAVAALYLELGLLEEAMTHLRESLRLNSDSPSTHYNLGFALSLRNSSAEALAEFAEAVRLDPEYAEAHNNLGAMLELQGSLADALGHYRRAADLRPRDAKAFASMGRVLLAQGRETEAVERFRQALDRTPDWLPALGGLAWIRATSSNAQLRRPDEAIVLAERAVAATGGRDAAAFDALAAAYASAGRFDKAVPSAQAGVQIAVGQGNNDLAEQIRKRLDLYERHQPYHAVRR